MLIICKDEFDWFFYFNLQCEEILRKSQSTIQLLIERFKIADEIPLLDGVSTPLITFCCCRAYSGSNRKLILDTAQCMMLQKQFLSNLYITSLNEIYNCILNMLLNVLCLILIQTYILSFIYCHLLLYLSVLYLLPLLCKGQRAAASVLLMKDRLNAANERLW